MLTSQLPASYSETTNFFFLKLENSQQVSVFQISLHQVSLLFPLGRKTTLILACSYLIFPLAQYSICHTEHLFHWPVCSSQTRHKFYFTYLKVSKKHFVFLK